MRVHVGLGRLFIENIIVLYYNKVFNYIYVAVQTRFQSKRVSTAFLVETRFD